MLGSDYAGDSEYADTRIRGTIVMYREEPVLVDGPAERDEDDAPTVSVVPISGMGPNKNKRLIAKLDDLDVCPFPLGFVNYSGTSSYLCRQPKRRDYKQGARSANIFSAYGFETKAIPYSAYHPTIMGEFPSFYECLAAIRSKDKEKPRVQSMAWSNDWAIDRRDNLLYKFGEPVGSVSPEGQLNLGDKHQHLTDQLRESLR